MEPEEALELLLNSDGDALMSAINMGLSPSVVVAGQSLLHWALATDQPRIAAALISVGAETESLSVANESPLMVASYMGDLQVVEALLDSAGEVNAVDRDGRSPLMFAARSGNPEVLRILMERGADTRALDSQGRSAAHWALVDGDHTDALNLLIKAGVPLIASQQGLTPLEYANRLGRTGCVNLMQLD